MLRVASGPLSLPCCFGRYMGMRACPRLVPSLGGGCLLLRVVLMPWLLLLGFGGRLALRVPISLLLWCLPTRRLLCAVLGGVGFLTCFLVRL